MERKQLKFDEKNHKYTLQGGQELISVTTLIHSCFPEFDTDKVATGCMNKAGYKGKTKEEIIAGWEKNRDEAAHRGTLLHEFAEDYLRGKDPEFIENLEDECEVMEDFIEEQLLTQYEFVDAEVRVFDTDWMVAGTVDLLMRNRETGKMAIFDWKTNKKINKFNRWSKGFGALNLLPDCNYTHYSLQLNMYKAILHNNDYYDMTDCEMALLHLDMSKEGVINIIDVEDHENNLGLLLAERGVL
jgi:ATP-dependent exoDNAse (exonuclease V) beta subunit